MSILVGEYFDRTQSQEELNDTQITRELECNTNEQEFLANDIEFK